MKELDYKPSEVERLIFKTEDGTSNYMHVSIEEMDCMMKYAKKYEELHNQWYKSINDKDDVIMFIRKCKEIIEDFEIPRRKSMI